MMRSLIILCFAVGIAGCQDLGVKRVSEPKRDVTATEKHTSDESPERTSKKELDDDTPASSGGTTIVPGTVSEKDIELEFYPKSKDDGTSGAAMSGGEVVGQLSSRSSEAGVKQIEFFYKRKLEIEPVKSGGSTSVTFEKHSARGRWFVTIDDEGDHRRVTILFSPAR